MDAKEFKKVVNDSVERILDVFLEKTVEYSRNDNALHNFEEGAKISGRLREQVLYGFSLKHTISINDMREGLIQGAIPSREMVEEKFTDAINYLILEKACYIDRLQKLGLDTNK